MSFVDTHAHTLASTHAYSTLYEYVMVAKQKGLAMFAITDHGPDMADAPHPWHFGNMKVWPRIIEGVGILRGIEANIKNLQGDTDCMEKMRPYLDLIMAGFHEPVLPPGDRAANTEAMVNTIRSGKVHVITHPGNPSYPVDFEQVTKAAAAADVALEVNNSSFNHSRSGSEPFCTEMVACAKEMGASVTVASDSHVAFSLGGLDDSLRVIAKVGFPMERVVNRSPRTLLDFLVRRGGEPITEFAHF